MLAPEQSVVLAYRTTASLYVWLPVVFKVQFVVVLPETLKAVVSPFCAAGAVGSSVSKVESGCVLPTQSLPMPSPNCVVPPVFTVSARAVALNESTVLLNVIFPLVVLAKTVLSCNCTAPLYVCAPPWSSRSDSPPRCRPP